MAAKKTETTKTETEIACEAEAAATKVRDRAKAVLDGELAKQATAQSALEAANAKARELFSSAGPDSPAYRAGLVDARKAREAAEEIAQSVAFAREVLAEAEEEHRVTSRRAVVARAREDQAAAFLDLFAGMVDSRVIPKVLEAYALLTEALAEANEIVAANDRAFSKLRERAGLGQMDLIPGEMPYARQHLSNVIERVQAAVLSDRLKRGPVEIAMLGDKSKPWASEIPQLVTDGQSRARDFDPAFIRQHTTTSRVIVPAEQTAPRA